MNEIMNGIARRGRMIVCWLFGLTLLLASCPPTARASDVRAYGVDDFDTLSIDQRLLLVSLQGLVNRAGPILWLRSGPNQSPGLLKWEETLPALRTQQHLRYAEVLARFARPEYVQGTVIVDPTLEETYNMALAHIPCRLLPSTR